MESTQLQDGYRIAEGTFWLPAQSSTIAPTIDYGWDVAYWVSVFLFILVVVPMFLFVWKYKRRHASDYGAPTGHNTALEITWSIIPLFVVMFCFVVGFKGYIASSVAPSGAYEVAVTAQKWAWSFTYPNGATTLNELHVPAGRPVKLIMSAKDVLHSFYIPEFRIKQDVIPGSYTSVWFQSDPVNEADPKTGSTPPKEYTILCAEFCGKDHSGMLAKAFVHTEEEFKLWLDKSVNEGGDLEPAKYGEQLYAKATCNTCHTVDGSPKPGGGPSWKGLFERSEKMKGGEVVTADENYIRESILNPNAKIVEGFPAVMPSFKGQLKDKQIDALIAYIKTLK